MTKEEIKIAKEYVKANELIDELDSVIEQIDTPPINDWFISLGNLNENDIFKYTRDLEAYIKDIRSMYDVN